MYFLQVIINRSNIEMKKIIGLLGIVICCSCASKKEFVYFQGIQEQAEAINKINEQKPLVIQHDDILAILVTSVNSDASNPYNIVRPDVPSGVSPVSDFLVDAEGNIEYPGLGEISVKGLTIVEVKEKIRSQLNPFLKDAVINVRIQNFRVNVLGEVRRPSSYIVREEKMTIIEALAQAGDITGFGDRKRVLVIREEKGERKVEEINLLDVSVFQSEYFYLRQNDTVYVPPTDGKAISARSAPLSQVVLPVLGFLSSLASLIIVATR